MKDEKVVKRVLTNIEKADDEGKGLNIRHEWGNSSKKGFKKIEKLDDDEEKWGWI